MSVLTPEVKLAMGELSCGHIPVFLFEKTFEVRGIKHMAAVTMMIRQDDTVYYRCIVDEYKVLDVEKLQHGAVAGWMDLEMGMTAMSRNIGQLIEQSGM